MSYAEGIEMAMAGVILLTAAGCFAVLIAVLLLAVTDSL